MYIQSTNYDQRVLLCSVCHLDSLHTTSVSTEAPSELVSEYVQYNVVNHTKTKESCICGGRGGRSDLNLSGALFMFLFYALLVEHEDQV